MKDIKISFLIPAHNEEKVISFALNNLLSLPHDNYEVLIGLDGCTDKTEEIVESFAKRSKRFKYFKLNIRKGKPEVINSLMKKATGEIIIIHDADWIFNYQSKSALKSYFSIFNYKKIGGIAESFPLEWDKMKMKSGDIGFKLVAYSSFFWLNFQKKRFLGERLEGPFFLIKEPKMFLTNIFRKKLYKKNSSLGDDFERTSDIIKQNYDIALSTDEKNPRFTSVYDKISLIDLFKVKIRTAKAREQLKGESKIGLFNYYLPTICYIITEGYRTSFYLGFLMLLWVFLTTIATITSKFKNFGTHKGWTMRAKR